MGTELYCPELCEACGRCLAACPVLRLDEAEASRAVARLAAGQWVSRVLDHCTGCMSCDALCPNDAHPFGLLLRLYSKRYAERGIPRVFSGAMPLRDGPNLWSGIDRWLSPAERGNLESWSRPPQSEEVLFLGCNQRLTPYVADSRVFDNISIFTDPGECCGEYYLRLGLLEEARARASSLAERFHRLGIRRVVAFCPACQNTMLNLAPRALGVDFGVEVVGLVDWLAREIESGRIAPAARLLGTVTVQDPCHASGIGAPTVETVRDLLRSTGLSVVEMENCGTSAECCGLGASLARYRLTDVVRTGVRRARQAGGTGADCTCAWCNGCYMVMNMFRLLYPWTPPVYHLLELLQFASGEKPNRQVPARSAQLVAAAVESTAIDYLSRGSARPSASKSDW